MAWNQSREETIGLPIDALAILVLQDYVAVNGWNWQNWMRESEQYGTARDPDSRLIGAPRAPTGTTPLRALVCVDVPVPALVARPSFLTSRARYIEMRAHIE
jgi:hypothetical protein